MTRECKGLIKDISALFAALALGGLIASAAASSVTRCRSIVMNDIKSHREFEAKLLGELGPRNLDDVLKETK